MHLPTKKEQNMNLLKRHMIGYNNGTPNKIYCSEDKKINECNVNTHYPISTKHCTFYGLPDMVKNLFLQIRGIDKLYSTYFIYQN